MSIIQPTTLPSWAYDNPTDPVSGLPAITEPSTAKKASGFLRLERPPRQDFNWLYNNIGQWVEHYKDVNTKKSFLEGFHIVQWPSDTEIEISTGKCVDDLNEKYIDGFLMDYPANFTKDIVGASYAFGSGSSGRADGVSLTASTWYHLFVFVWDDGGTLKVDLCFDTSVTGDNLPGVATCKRRIMSLYYDTVLFTGFVKVTQYGDYFESPLTSYTFGGPWAITNQCNIASTGDPRVWVDFSGALPADIDCIADIIVNKNQTPSADKDVIMRSTYEMANPSGFITTVIVGSEGDYYTRKVRRFVPGNDQRFWCGYSENDTQVDTLFVNFLVVGYTDLRGKDWGGGPTPTPTRYIDHTIVP